MKPTNRNLAGSLTALCLIIAIQTSPAMYDPYSQRWLNRDPMAERGGINLLRFTANNPLGRVDLFGLSIVVSDTGNPITVSGNPGPGNGQGAQLFGIVPPGSTCGGSNPIPGYATREEAMAQYRDPSNDPAHETSDGDISDIDFIDLPSATQHPLDRADIKTSGDDQGPHVTVRNGPFPGSIHLGVDFGEWLDLLLRTLGNHMPGTGCTEVPY